MRVVCKTWSVPGRHIPAVAIDKLPWALKESSWVDDDCRLLDPSSREYVTGKFVGGIRVERHVRTKVSASAYGLCSPGDISWRTLEFNCGLESGDRNLILSVVYANGVFYYVFARGQLGAFNLQLEEWTILGGPFASGKFSFLLNLIVIDADVWVFDRESFELFRFDFSEMRWVYVKELKKHALFVGRTSFAVPAVGETSVLANTIFSCGSDSPSVRCYGSTCGCGTSKESLLYRKCVEATKRAMTWIQLPSAGIWTADDLIKAV
ncbi:hypothetical protein V6N11_042957 [Hibiscus sabdariffa]|uniref:KIB1-4 beta-propeller domain-containing protein n=1 Tax=Hibiscus sabdariffa TaxID=183260 RepID=A0ABR2QYH5_9ROSI